jgi:hypothetical protein
MHQVASTSRKCSVTFRAALPSHTIVGCWPWLAYHGCARPDGPAACAHCSCCESSAACARRCHSTLAPVTLKRVPPPAPLTMALVLLEAAGSSFAAAFFTALLVTSRTLCRCFLGTWASTFASTRCMNERARTRKGRSCPLCSMFRLSTSSEPLEGPSECGTVVALALPCPASVVAARPSLAFSQAASSTAVALFLA